MARISMGWLTCIPFDYDPLTGEPIVQCNSISDQVPCPAGVVEYPGNGYCPSTVNGFVPELFGRLPGVAGLRGFRGFRGLGDCLATQVDSGGMCPDGSAYTGVLDEGGAGANACTPPYSLINGVCQVVPNYAAEAAAALGTGTPAPSSSSAASTLPLTLPALMLPPGVTASASGLQTNITCPTGYQAVGGVCSPVAAAPSTTNWLLIGGGILAAVVVIAMVARR
jgi:hypothetical protein